MAMISNIQDLKANALKAISFVETFKTLQASLSENPEANTVEAYESAMGQDFAPFFRKTFGLELKSYIEEKNTSSYKRHSNFYYLEMFAAYLRIDYPDIDDTTAYIVILVLYKQSKS